MTNTTNQLMVLKFQEDVQAKYIKRKAEGIIVTKSLVEKICIANNAEDVIRYVLNHTKTTTPITKTSTYDWIELNEFIKTMEKKRMHLLMVDEGLADSIESFVNGLAQIIIDVRDNTDSKGKKSKSKLKITKEMFTDIIRESASKDFHRTSVFIAEFLAKGNVSNLFDTDAVDNIFKEYSADGIEAFYKTLQEVIK